MGLLWLTLTACKPEPEDTMPATGATSVVALPPAQAAVRASMAIRGIRPSLDEIAAVQADPNALPSLVDAWLDAPEFGATVKDLYAELIQLRTDVLYQLPQKGILDEKGVSQGAIYDATVDSPLLFIEDIIVNDRSYAEVFTADYMLTNEVLADIYGLVYDPEGPEWQQSHWSDGRPQSGLLSDSEMWRRHVSNAANFHRGRANFLSKTFLCADIASRDVFVESGIDISDPMDVADAVNNLETCVGCHAVLDPLAAHWWGYKEQLKRNAVDTAYAAECSWDYSNGEPPRGVYRPEHFCYPLRFYDVVEQDRWSIEGLQAPNFYGMPTEDMTDVGFLLVDDPRFAQCTAKTWYAYLGQVERDAVPIDVAMAFQDVLTASDFRIKELVRAIVLDPAFLASSAGNDPHAYVPGLRTIRPEQYARTVADLTGFQWLANEDDDNCAEGVDTCWHDVDLANSDLYGFRSMMGGIDGYTVSHPTHSPTPTKLLAMGRMADEAAGFVVDADFGLPIGSRRLFNGIELNDVSEVAVKGQIAGLYKRIIGVPVPVHDPAVVLVYDRLFAPVLAGGGTASDAWKLTVSGLLQDPAMMFW